MKRPDSRGFTLIELLIVVVVIGILATIAIPKFSAMRQKSYIASVTSDLKNLASQQEIYLSNQLREELAPLSVLRLFPVLNVRPLAVPSHPASPGTVGRAVLRAKGPRNNSYRG